MTPWEFAESWYDAASIKRSIVRRAPTYDAVPENVYSDAFAEWLCNEYRLAMSKGIMIGREWEKHCANG